MGNRQWAKFYQRNYPTCILLIANCILPIKLFLKNVLPLITFSILFKKHIPLFQ